MSRVVLIYPYRRPRHDRATFRLPPLGLAYVAQGLRQAGHEVEIVDCTFMGNDELKELLGSVEADVAGFYVMVTMAEEALGIARELKGRVRGLMVGGPLASAQPGLFARDFDAVVRGEGEVAADEVVKALCEAGVERLAGIAGVSYRPDGGPHLVHNPRRAATVDLDSMPFPARDLLPNSAYIADGRRRHGKGVSSIMTSRGCPYSCEFCSNPVFGRSFRSRSAAKVVEELEEIASLGYERVHFADDVFTLDRARLIDMCRLMEERRLGLEWECLARVDSLDDDVAQAMRSSGCYRVYFGIESGNDEVLALMGKRVDREAIRRGVMAVARAGIEAGGFFILCYPGETDDTVLQTIAFAKGLPLQYASFGRPYALAGTRLFERVRIEGTGFSRPKTRLAVGKGRLEFYLHRHFGPVGRLGAYFFEKATTVVFRALR